MCCEAFLHVGKPSVIAEELYNLVEIRQGVAAVDLHLNVDGPDVCELWGYA